MCNWNNKVNSFQKVLADKQLQLTRGKTTTLQVNIGHLCNLVCKHCHMDAGPGRKEIMTKETMDAVGGGQAVAVVDGQSVQYGFPAVDPAGRVAPVLPTFD